MLRVSFLATLFSLIGITSVVASPGMPATWVGEVLWLLVAGGCVIAVMASEGESA